jgi:Peptidase family M1 domain/Secretion system C-terminal sorting domain
MDFLRKMPKWKTMPILISMLKTKIFTNFLRSRFVAVAVLLCCTSTIFAATYPAKYDIVYHRLSFTVNPATAATSGITNGSVTTYFKTTANNVSQIGFDFASGMSVGTVTYHGVALPGANVTRPGNVVLITLSSTIATMGTLDSVTINFSGLPTAAGSPVPSGWNANNTKASVYTLGESFTGSTWWPCHDSLTDKIDSVDMIATTPSAYRVAGNGVVTESISGANRICTWKTRYRIATYMINFAAANYVNYQYNITTGGKTLPVLNYLYSADNTAPFRTGTDFIQTILPVYVSVLNDDYPFIDEKYGIADCYGNWGALEVQSMTFCATSSIQDNATLAHELAHQWFGDKLTTNDWHQVWLNEGFATYFEKVVYPENLLGASAAQTSRTNLKGSVGSATTAYVANISSANNIFAGADQPYPKGAMILSMLRAWIGDTKFFTALHNYLQAPGLAYNFTSVDSLKFYMQQQTPNDLTNFFSDWINQKGTVTYAVKYQYVTKGVYIQLTQSPSSAGAGYFDTPVPIQIKNSSGLDTTIVVIDRNGVLYNSVTGATYNSNTIYFPLSATPTIAPVVDPKDVVLADASTTTASTTIASLILPYQKSSLEANVSQGRARIHWMLETDQPFSKISIERSADGKTYKAIADVKPEKTSQNSFEGDYVDADALAATTYYRLRVTGVTGEASYSPVKVVHNNANEVVRISPNPVHDKINIQLPQNFATNTSVTKILVYASAGQLMMQIAQPAGKTSASIDATSLPKGYYSVVVVNGNEHPYETTILKD